MMMMMAMLASSSTSLFPGHPHTHPAHLTAIQAHSSVLSKKKSSYRVVFLHLSILHLFPAEKNSLNQVEVVIWSPGLVGFAGFEWKTI